MYGPSSFANPTKRIPMKKSSPLFPASIDDQSLNNPTVGPFWTVHIRRFKPKSSIWCIDVSPDIGTTEVYGTRFMLSRYSLPLNDFWLDSHSLASRFIDGV
jgi:hypothetical protein